jgi:hypothetical protein
MMKDTVAAYTKVGAVYPGYINVGREGDGTIVLNVRADPTVREGEYICGHASDRGAPGRCTPGDSCCNNYCNLAPEKGPMVDSPLPCTQTFEGATASLRLSAGEWAKVLREIMADA